MRGRLWSMFIVQIVEGAFCLVMGVVTMNSDAPSTSSEKTIGLFTHSLNYNHMATNCYNSTSDWATVACPAGGAVNDDYDFDLCHGHKDYMLTTCGSKDFKTKGMEKICQFYGGVEYEFTGKLGLPKRILTSDINGDDCICNSGLVGAVVLIMICFSICVQMAEGLHFGVVPYVSRPALGIVSGMVGAGGNAGAVLTLWTIFKQVDRTDTGFIILGIVVMAESLLMLGIYFPEHGGLFFKAGALNYDPQRWKPPADLRGADQMDYGAATTTKDTTTTKA